MSALSIIYLLSTTALLIMAETTFKTRRITARQVGGEGCMPPASVLSAINALPTKPSDLDITQACAHSATGAQVAEFTSYSDAISSWWVSNSGLVQSFEATYDARCSGVAHSTFPPSDICVATSTGSTLTSSASMGITASSAASTKGTTPSGGGGLSTGDKAAIGVAVPVGVLLIAAVAYFAGRMSRSRRNRKAQNGAEAATAVEKDGNTKMRIDDSRAAELDSSLKTELPGEAPYHKLEMSTEREPVELAAE